MGLSEPAGPRGGGGWLPAGLSVGGSSPGTGNVEHWINDTALPLAESEVAQATSYQGDWGRSGGRIVYPGRVGRHTGTRSELSTPPSWRLPLTASGAATGYSTCPVGTISEPYCEHAARQREPRSMPHPVGAGAPPGRRDHIDPTVQVILEGGQFQPGPSPRGRHTSARRPSLISVGDSQSLDAAWSES